MQHAKGGTGTGMATIISNSVIPAGTNPSPAGGILARLAPKPLKDRRVAATDDQALMQDIASGHRPALARLMAQHARGVALFAGRFLGNVADGDDVAQETFLRVWAQARKYDASKASVTTWIYRIATNLCIDRQRRNRFWRLFGRVQTDDVADILPDDAASATQSLAAKQRLAQVRASIATLPARQRMAILLTAVSEMEVAAVAAVMKTSTGAVEQLLVRARRSLRAMEGEQDAG
jgi:RNA polymerase sigma-70 factor, ECF subfamily